MKLWTFQPVTIAEQLSNGISYFCDPDKSELLADDCFKPSYNWLSDDMVTKGYRKPAHVIYPIWAWHTNYGLTKKPDRRKLMFNNFPKDDVLMEVNVDDSRVILSDHDKWHGVLNNSLIISDERFDSMTDEELDKVHDNCSQQEKEQSWQNIYDVKSSEFIQACLWELHPEDVVKIHKL